MLAALLALAVVDSLLELETGDVLVVLVMADDVEEDVEEDADWTSASPLTTGGGAEEINNP